MATSPQLTLALVSDCELLVKGLAKMLGPFASRVRIIDPASRRSDVPVDVALYACLTVDQSFAADVKARHFVLYTLIEEAAVLADARTSDADAVLSSSLGPEDLLDALERICAGETLFMVDEDTSRDAACGHWPGQAAGLSAREAQVIALIAQGLSNEEIGHTLFLSTNTVKSYIRSAYRRMNVTSRSQAILWAVDHGLRRQSAIQRLNIPTVPAERRCRQPDPRCPAPVGIGGLG